MSSDSFKNLNEGLQAAGDAFRKMAKHFDGHDTRHPSPTHNAGASQNVHGNRPGARTQSGLLSSWQVLPSDWSARTPERQTDYFLRATGYSTPVIDVGGGKDHYLAPPGVKMLPERGAGMNVDSPGAGTPGEPNTQLGQGLDEQDRLSPPGPPDSEEHKRYLEAAAEHRQNDYKGPTTPRFEQMWGDELRSKHPARAPQGHDAPAAVQHKALTSAVRAMSEPGPRLHRAGAHRDEVVFVGNVLQTVPEAGKEVAQAAVSAVAGSAGGGSSDVPGRRSPAPVQPPQYGQPSAASEEASATASRNAEAQTQGAEQRVSESQTAAAERKQRLAALRQRGRRLPGRLQ